MGTGWVEGGAQLQYGIREWEGMSSSVGTWRRPTNLSLGVVEAGPLRTVRSPKRTVREAGCYSYQRIGSPAPLGMTAIESLDQVVSENYSYVAASSVMLLPVRVNHLRYYRATEQSTPIGGLPRMSINCSPPPSTAVRLSA